MSWYISTLLKQSESIKEAGDITSDEFNDLLAVEKEISRLKRLKLLTNKEIKILNAITSNKSSYQLEKELGMDREIIYRIFDMISERLAFFLGHEFTDYGFLTYLKLKYKLKEEQMQTLAEFIKSRYKYSTKKRKPDGLTK